MNHTGELVVAEVASVREVQRLEWHKAVRDVRAEVCFEFGDRQVRRQDR